MKSILPRLAILAALALAGCNQNRPGNPTDTPATNSTLSEVNSTTAGLTNLAATNRLPLLNTNRLAGSNLSTLY